MSEKFVYTMGSDPLWPKPPVVEAVKDRMERLSSQKKFQEHLDASMKARNDFYLEHFKKLLLDIGIVSEATRATKIERELVAAYQHILTERGIEFVIEDTYVTEWKCGIRYWNYLHNKVKETQ